MIDSFEGPHRFLSNFYPSPISYEDELYPCVENAYQAAKTLDKEIRKQFLPLSPAAAKRLGRKVSLRPDWESVKFRIMEELVREKFFHNEELGRHLLMIFPEELVEGNDWHDQVWGVCKGKGQNHLGKILMKIREELGEK